MVGMQYTVSLAMLPPVPPVQDETYKEIKKLSKKKKKKTSPSYPPPPPSPCTHTACSALDANYLTGSLPSSLGSLSRLQAL